MEISKSIKKIMFGATILLSGFLGAKVGNFSYKYEVVTEGLLGIFFIYLFLKAFWQSGKDLNKDEYSFLQAVRLIAYVFVYSVVCFWALVRIADFIEIILKL